MVYYHVVFTMPSELNGLCLRNPRFMYDTLFDSAWATLQKFAADPKWLGAQTGATMVLHIPTFGTGQALGPEPEPVPIIIGMHGIVPGGGLDTQGRWLKSRAGGDRFLYPVKAMWRVYRAIFMKKLCAALESGELVLPESEPVFYDQQAYLAWKNARYAKPWVVYAKRPFGGPKQSLPRTLVGVIEYLGRYMHKTAISNHRLLGGDGHGGAVLLQRLSFGGQKEGNDARRCGVFAALHAALPDERLSPDAALRHPVERAKRESTGRLPPKPCPKCSGRAEKNASGTPYSGFGQTLGRSPAELVCLLQNADDG